MSSGYTTCPCCSDDTVSSDVTIPELCSLCIDAKCAPALGLDPDATCQRPDLDLDRDPPLRAPGWLRARDLDRILDDIGGTAPLAPDGDPRDSDYQTQNDLNADDRGI